MNDEKYKRFCFFDLDGTLLNHQSEVDERLLLALVALKNNGIIPVIATGRTNTEIQHVLDDTVIESSITMNGQYVLFEGEEIYSDLISSDVVDKMLQKQLKKDIGLVCITKKVLPFLNKHRRQSGL